MAEFLSSDRPARTARTIAFAITQAAPGTFAKSTPRSPSIFATRTTAEWMAFSRKPTFPIRRFAPSTIWSTIRISTRSGFSRRSSIRAKARSSRCGRLTYRRQQRCIALDPAPMLGEHSREILRELGLAPQESIDAICSPKASPTARKPLKRSRQRRMLSDGFCPDLRTASDPRSGVGHLPPL